ncbi:acetate--CoA ligase family protein [Neorhizobium galegae]|uniref:acetate--CoA ligase family protein n=1 Tax=Neorhizobium galegae TaxID=399 RepID=UPI00062140CC|nr:acetate--CoA ligase family protein [Neorhizobium galegae]CDZ25825.1 Acyl-CoA synthetase (NDP forming) [Neorhizobium galegae bv. officinalis]KAA9388516.1 acetate--CoA ligase family protein [Neorhizobium galegae]KAB1114090.1 acetate--CoA ligase family protein [Neorhizobium galegae]MCM2497031.1 acetate--CoA ligase family protein [Neorhizobium galegae]MCQ1771099.1 acetate--CoA ligase family protein [Neorhizobium galegae]
MTANTPEAMQALMAPRSIAVVGATERADASSSYVMKNLMRFGYQGQIIPVHPKAGTIFGLPASHSLSALESAPDVAVIGIAADKVIAALEEAGSTGVKAAVVLASGFAELDEAGRERQRQLVEIAERYGMAICGPNCLGLFNLGSGAALYSSSLSTNLQKGRFAILSHSGASAIALGNTGRFGLSHVVSSGNSAATDIPDYLDFLATDDQTSAVGIVIEAIRDPEKLAAAMEKMHAANKPVIALRAGRSERGAQATAAHTGSLAGSNDAYRAFFRRVGIIEVPDMDNFMETATLCLSLKQRPAKPGVAIVGVSGGGVAHVSDIADEVGLSLPDLQPETAVRVKTLLPPFATPQNPLDTTGVVFADGGIYRDVLHALADDPSIGLIVATQDAPAGLDDFCASEYLGIAEAVSDYAGMGKVPVVFMSNLSSGHHSDVEARLSNVPVLRGTKSALTAVRSLITQSGVVSWPDKVAATKKTLPPGALTEREAKQLLAAEGLPVPREQLVTSADAAADAAKQLGFPVVMKIESPDILHKTEAGGVKLGIASETEARAAFDVIMANARAYAPDAALRGVSVQEMVTGGIEALVGLVRHEPFGFGLVVGIGGVLVELVKDSAFDLLPIDLARADAMIGETKLASLLEGYRGAPKADRQALAELLVRLSEFAAHYGDDIEAIDLNPVAVLPDGKGVRILDALIIPRKMP